VTARDQTGSATIWMVSAIAVVVMMAVAAIGVGSVVLARHRAGNAADAAALAAAADAIDGPAAACARGAAIARLDGARLISCSLQDAVAAVRVTVALPRAIRALAARTGEVGTLSDASGQARAGPVSVARGVGSPEMLQRARDTPEIHRSRSTRRAS
jgi:secretion/DNA translocation related TadE-like protein